LNHCANTLTVVIGPEPVL